MARRCDLGPRTGGSTGRWMRSTASGRVGSGRVAPNVARWLGELRGHFPSGVVRVVQQDAIDRLGLHRLLLEPEVLDNVTPDVHLAATLMSLKDALPEGSRAVARRLVRQVVEDIERRLADRTRAAARGALDRSARTSRPKPAEIDWDRTIRANLKHYQADAQDGDPGAAGRARAQAALARRRADPRARSEREHGRQRDPRGCARGGARLAAHARDAGDRVRHRDRRPDRAAARSGRGAVRHPARRRDRHRSGARVLPDAGRQPGQDRAGPRDGSLRGRRRRVDAAPRREPAPRQACG